MKVLRTPDDRFANLKDYQFSPHYTTIKTANGVDLRIHHIDEGPFDGPTVLCMHGQPAWSYLYRKMIPILVKFGCRVIAPDLVGYGKSDKPAAREDFSYQDQVDWMSQWLIANNLGGLTFFGQDWGGLIGLRLVAAHPDRFDRVVISNTGLPYSLETQDSNKRLAEQFWAEESVPSLTEMAAAIGQMSIEERPFKFAYWQKYCWGTEDLPAGLLMSLSTETRAVLANGSTPNPEDFLKSEIVKAYDAPFPDPSFKMGIRAMPRQVPFFPDDPSTQAQLDAWKVFDEFNKPFLCAFSDDDPVTGGLDAEFIERVPGAHGRPHLTISGGGHFIQENKPEAISEVIASFIQST